VSAQGISRNLSSYGDDGFSRYLRNAFLSAAGYGREESSRPVVGITDLRSDYNPCHRQMGELLDNVKRGVLAAGGLPLVFPTASLGETFLNPTSMLYRNMLAMETEELVRAQPMDAVVMLGGCDKTVPAQARPGSPSSCTTSRRPLNSATRSAAVMSARTAPAC